MACFELCICKVCQGRLFSLAFLLKQGLFRRFLKILLTFWVFECPFLGRIFLAYLREFLLFLACKNDIFHEKHHQKELFFLPPPAQFDILQF